MVKFWGQKWLPKTTKLIVFANGWQTITNWGLPKMVGLWVVRTVIFPTEWQAQISSQIKIHGVFFFLEWRSIHFQPGKLMIPKRWWLYIYIFFFSHQMHFHTTWNKQVGATKRWLTKMGDSRGEVLTDPWTPTLPRHECFKTQCHMSKKTISKYWVSNEKNLRCLGCLLGMTFPTRLCGDYNKPW